MKSVGGETDTAFFLNRNGTKTTVFFGRCLFTCLQGWSCTRIESKYILMVTLFKISYSLEVEALLEELLLSDLLSAL